MKEEKREKIQDTFDKTPLPQHTFLSKELIRRKLVDADSDFELYQYDELFETLLERHTFKTVLVCTGYTITCIKRNKFKDEQGNDIECLYAYFRVALKANIEKYLRPPVRLGWMDDD